MAVASSRGNFPRHWRDHQDTSPERTKVWVEPKQRSSSLRRRVPVVYYLCRNGQLEHPHFMEVALSSPDGLYLKDVIDRLNLLRGKGMTSMYSWSSKRSYKNGYVWHDLTDDDLILPAHGNEYVLKGSELLYTEISPIPQETNSSSSSSFERPPEQPSRNHRRTSWGGSVDMNEYKVYKSDPATAIPSKAADVSTQTEEHRRPPRRRSPDFPPVHQPPAELNSDEISPPPSSSSPETLETLIKTEVRSSCPKNTNIAPSESLDEDRTVGSIAGGRIKATAVLMQLISCGSIQVKDPNYDPNPREEYGGKMNRGRSDLKGKETDGEISRVGFDPMDREYFSGSLIETKKKNTEDCANGFNGLKRSNSYNADRSSKMEVREREMETYRAKCIPRKSRTVIRRETVVNNNNDNSSKTISKSNLGSKRISDVKSHE